MTPHHFVLTSGLFKGALWMAQACQASGAPIGTGYGRTPTEAVAVASVTAQKWTPFF